MCRKNDHNLLGLSNVRASSPAGFKLLRRMTTHENNGIQGAMRKKAEPIKDLPFLFFSPLALEHFELFGLWFIIAVFNPLATTFSLAIILMHRLRYRACFWIRVSISLISYTIMLMRPFFQELSLASVTVRSVCQSDLRQPPVEFNSP